MLDVWMEEGREGENGKTRVQRQRSAGSVAGRDEGREGRMARQWSRDNAGMVAWLDEGRGGKGEWLDNGPETTQGW